MISAGATRARSGSAPGYTNLGVPRPCPAALCGGSAGEVQCPVAAGLRSDEAEFDCRAAVSEQPLTGALRHIIGS